MFIHVGQIRRQKPLRYIFEFVLYPRKLFCEPLECATQTSICAATSDRITPIEHHLQHGRRCRLRHLHLDAAAFRAHQPQRALRLAPPLSQRIVRAHVDQAARRPAPLQHLSLHAAEAAHGRQQRRLSVVQPLPAALRDNEADRGHDGGAAVRRADTAAAVRFEHFAHAENASTQAARGGWPIAAAVAATRAGDGDTMEVGNPFIAIVIGVIEVVD